ncbi:hypothetical protein SE17_19145, partial [Kouleothrix aurantiaca]
LKLSLLTRPHDDSGIAFFSLCVSRYHAPPAPAQLLVQVADVTEQYRLHTQSADRHAEIRYLNGELKHHHAALQTASEELRRADRANANFVTVAAHELRNPLTPLLGYLELLLDDECGPLTREQRATLEVMLENVLRLRNVTSNLLDLAQIESGHVELALYPTDLPTLVEIVCLRYREQLELKQQQLELIIGDLPLVLCDETRATQIIDQIINNANKYTPPNGKITVRLECRDDAFVVLTVQNSGAGVPAADQPYLFDAFFRTPAAAVASSGTGLGLHLARLLIELHGGAIWFEPLEGEGSMFCLTFLACEAVPV